MERNLTRRLTNVLVLRPGALGDTLLALPALRGLRAAGFAPVTLAAHPGAARLLESVGEVERGLAFDDPSLAWLLAEDDSAHGSLVAPESPRGERLIAWFNSRGMAALRRAVVVAAGRPATEQHCAEYLLETLAPLGVDTLVDDRPLKVRPHRADEILVHPGSGSPAKNWPAERFADTIRLLDRPVRLIVGEADAQAADAVERHLGRAVPRLEHAPLEELAKRLAGCAGYLGNDSGVSQLAGLCGTRTVVMFGPTSPTVWRPLGSRVTVLDFKSDAAEVVELLTRTPHPPPSPRGRGSWP